MYALPAPIIKPCTNPFPKVPNALMKPTSLMAVAPAVEAPLAIPLVAPVSAAPAPPPDALLPTALAPPAVAFAPLLIPKTENAKS